MRAVRLSSSGVVGLAALVALAGVAVAGCNNPPTRPRGDAGRGGGGDGGPGSGETGAQCSDGIDNDADGVTDCDESSCFTSPGCGHDGGVRPDGGFMGCEALPFEAETRLAPVDIIWIVDNSGSMDEETSLIQMNINNFAASISASGIDYHVVMITDPAAHGLMVPPPLGTDAMRYRLVVDNVQSNDTMSHLISTYSMWSDFLRPDSVVHFVHVTDDESDMSASTFRTMMTALLMGGRDSGTFTSHAIASPPGSMGMMMCPLPPPFPCLPAADACSGPHGDAAANGDEFWSIAMMTGGEQISICSADWTVVFDTLEESIAVGTTIPCEFDIPEPPEGMTFDRMRVNVVYQPGGGGAEITIPFVGTATGAACPASGNGWYYDDPTTPTQIIMCPASCDTIEADTSGRVDIALGCETVFG